MDMAALHTAHPLAEDLPVIEPALQARDAALAARLREALTGNLNPADATSLAASVARTQAVLQEARQALVPPAVAGDLAFRGNLLAALIDAAAEEYGEALSDGALKRRDEYDDGYGFFQQALSLWGGLADEVRASAPLEHRE
ncbi:MAG: hypothetical protein HYY05_01640, partial [Chloroflexi bacterium]|nr:hypothetical protein [Chloroflexota bacterium]